MKKRLFEQDARAKKMLVASIGLGLIGGVLIIVQAVYLAKVTNGAFLEHKSLFDMLPPLYLLLTWIVFRSLLHFASEYVATQMAVSVKSELRKRLVRHISQLGPTFVKGERGGELLSTIIEGVEQLEIFVAKYLPQLALSMLLPFAVFILVVRIDWVTAIVLAITFPLLILFMILIGVTTRQRTEKQFKTLGLLAGHFLDVLRGLTTLKLFNRSKAQLQIIADISERNRKATMSTLYLAFLSAFVMELFSTISTAVIAVFLGLRLIAGQIPFEHAYLVLLLAPEFYLPVRALGTQFHAGANGTAAAKRIFAILDEQPSGYVTEVGGIQLASQGPYQIRFEQVTFTYPGADTPVLEQLSFTVEAGQHAALVGMTGAGKSTVLDLLQGFLKPTAGRILIDGVDLAQLDMVWWREQYGWVAQKPHLFQGSIADNIRLSKPNAGLVEVQLAARAAYADGFISELQAGYDTSIEETAQLSGGQLSRIAIARAIFKQAPMLLMDEPTAQLDQESEQAIIHALAEYLKGKTALFVAHRMAMTTLADQVIEIGGAKV
jgi:thiol reductant ABC exporter CydD subunit